MGVIRNQALGAGLLALVACASPADRNDLVTNPTLYAPTAYKAKVAVDRSAFVAPLVDERQPVAEASGPYPVSYVGEAVWFRPVLTMVDEIVYDELRDSGVFVEASRSAPGSDALIVTPYLRSANCGEEEQPAGRRSLSDVELRVVVHGPGADAGSRPVLLDRTFREIATTAVEMDPAPATQLLGIALRKSITKMLEVLDQSNVARSGVPMDPAVTGR